MPKITLPAKENKTIRIKTNEWSEGEENRYMKSDD